MQRTRGVVVRPLGDRWRLVDIRGLVVMQATNPEVANIPNHPGAYFPLDVQSFLIDSLIFPVVFRAADQCAGRNDEITRCIVLWICQGYSVLGELQGRC